MIRTCYMYRRALQLKFQVKSDFITYNHHHMFFHNIDCDYFQWKITAQKIWWKPGKCVLFWFFLRDIYFLFSWLLRRSTFIVYFETQCWKWKENRGGLIDFLSWKKNMQTCTIYMHIITCTIVYIVLHSAPAVYLFRHL